jgi:hypothetical protein
MRRFARVVAILLAILLALASSAVLLLYSPLGGDLVRRATEGGVSALIAGSLEIGEVEFRGWGEIIARDAKLIDPDGRTVVEADELVLAVKPLAALRMEISMPEVTLRRGTLHLYEGEDQLPSFLDALAPAEPSLDDSPSAITARVPRIRIKDLDVRGELLGVEGLRIEGATLEGSLEYLEDELTIRVDSLEGLVTGPVARPLPIRGENVVIDTRPEIGSSLSLSLGTADERVSVDLRYALPETGEGEEVLSLEASIHEVRPETLAELGLAGVDALEGAVSGEITLRGPTDALTLKGQLEHSAGTVTLEGAIGETIELRAKSERFAAQRLVPAAPDIAPSFDATLTLEEDRAPRVALELSAFEVDGVKVPPTRSTLSLEDDRLEISSASATLSTGKVNIAGSIHHDGRLDLRVDARLSSVRRTEELRALAPGLDGGASVDARITGTLDSPRVRGGFVLAPFAYGPFRAARLAVSGDVAELLSAPSMSVRVEAKSASLWDEPLGNVSLTVGGRGGALVAKGTLGREGQGTIDARFDVGDVFRLHHGIVRTAPFVFDARDVVVSRRETSIGMVHVRHGPGKLTLSGTIRERGPDRLQLDIADVLIEDLRSFVDLPFEALTGTVSLHAELEGDLQKDPSIFAQGALEDIAGGGLEGAFASFFYRHDDGHSLAQFQVDLGEGGSGAVGLNAYVDLTRGDLRAALEEAYFDISVDVIGFDLELTQPVLPEELGEVTGHVDGSLRFSGLLDALEIDARVETRNARLLGLPELTYVLTVQREYGSLTIDLKAKDEVGLLAEARASTVGNALALLQDPATAAESLALAPWLFRARIPERSIRALPSVLISGVPEGLLDANLALSLEAQGGSLEPRVDAKGVFLVPRDVLAVCGASRQLSLPFALRVRDGDASLEGELLMGSRVAGTIRASAAPDLERLLERGELEPSPIELTLSLKDTRLGNLPYVCEYVSGDVSGEVKLVDFLGDTPRAMGYLQSSSIRISRGSEGDPGIRRFDTPPLSLGASFGVDTDRAVIDFSFRSGLASRLRVDGSAPLALVPRGLFRFDEEAPFSVFFDVENAPLALLLGFMPAFANVEGMADGWGRLGGTLDAPVHHAELSVRDGRFTITSLGQRVSDVEAVATLDRGRLRLKHLRARDGDGRVTARGEMSIQNLAPKRAKLAIELEGFPIRDEGTVVAALRGKGQLDATFAPERADATLVMRDLTVSLPTLGGPSIQDLAEHPDIRIVGEHAEDEEPEDMLPFALALHVDATEPFEVKGPEFNASLSADLRIEVTGDSLRIGGVVDLHGGRFSVLGKPFNVTAGSLRFDPRDETLSPAVSLTAVYLVDGNRDKRVIVTVGGTLSEPTVRFSSNIPTQNEGEIISLIVTGETHSETDRDFDSAAAGRDAADFVAGVAFGVVSLSLREEFGGFLPVVTLEGQSRFRARFDAERFLPERVRRVVRRARIEGYFTAGQAGEEDQVRQSGQAQGSGFSVELGFPRGIVGRGTVSPPNNWSTQVLWEP